MFRMNDMNEVADGDPGYYCITEHQDGYFQIALKLPNNQFTILPLNTDKAMSWNFDNDKDKPTLNPSVISWIPIEGRQHEGWCGKITKGKMVSKTE